MSRRWTLRRWRVYGALATVAAMLVGYGVADLLNLT